MNAAQLCRVDRESGQKADEVWKYESRAVVNKQIAAASIRSAKPLFGGSIPPRASNLWLMLSLRGGVQSRGGYVGGGVDFYLSLASRTLYYAPVFEIGSSPLSLFSAYTSSITATVGAAWVNSPSDLEGTGLSAVWPLSFFRTIMGVFGGTNEAFGTLTAIANRTRYPQWKDLAAIVGYSPSGGSYFQMGIRSNAFGTTASYSGMYRQFSPDLKNSLGFAGDLIDRAVETLNTVPSTVEPETYVDLLGALQ